MVCVQIEIRQSLPCKGYLSSENQRKFEGGTEARLPECAEKRRDASNFVLSSSILKPAIRVPLTCGNVALYVRQATGSPATVQRTAPRRRACATGNLRPPKIPTESKIIHSYPSSSFRFALSRDRHGAWCYVSGAVRGSVW